MLNNVIISIKGYGGMFSLSTSGNLYKDHKFAYLIL